MQEPMVENLGPRDAQFLTLLGFIVWFERLTVSLLSRQFASTYYYLLEYIYRFFFKSLDSESKMLTLSKPFNLGTIPGIAKERKTVWFWYLYAQT